ncbi:peroxiredoxin [Litorimonas taeanensis]|uniref:Glutathione-dependent peroxiredoxin n=1 Tax=Litorimonas taeanensis TaxID=568099 RepID=A0A420WE42_9PROT|nr:peroxiredoxin [Litorimonas taeanensis]RKQ69263.1 peroxiredoxin [Litorimonas taeanensis]
MTIQTGDKLPQASFMTFGENGPEPKSTDDIFSGKKVALFAVPGAFTPTCSAKHLPGFVEQSAALKAAGIDDIACLSVNDVFVMGAWGEQQEVGTEVAMLADGNGDFTKEIGLELDGTGFGMGQRSQRYAMVVNDGVVEQLFVEAPGEFKVSSAEHMLNALKS